MHRRSRAWKALALGLVAATGMVVLTSTAVAQEETPEPGGVDAETYRPAFGPGGLMVVEGTDTAGHLRPYAGLFVDMLSDPVVLRFEEDDRREAVIEQQANAHVGAGVGLGERFQLEAAIPILLMNQGEYLGEPLGGAGAGDLEFRAKGWLFSSQDNPVGLGAMIDATAPTGRSEVFRGDSSVTATPRVVADMQMDTVLGELAVASNAGVLLRSTRRVHDLEMGPEFQYGAGAELEVIPQSLRVGVDLFGGVGLVEPSRETSPLEWLAGLKLEAFDGLFITAGAGGGIVGGVGNPAWRGVLGLNYRPDELAPEPPPPAPVVEEPECPPEPEGFTGPYDEDGCPITPENYTGCDDLADEWEGTVDEWGCPDWDADGDGVLAGADECHRQTEEFTGVEDTDGCPNDDIDGDGIANVEDHCLEEAGLRAYNGCPPPVEEERVAVGDEQIEIDERIHFETDKAIIKRESYELLEEVALVLRENSQILAVEVAGHTDQRGEADYNMMLSEERAKAVREFLIRRGNVSPARLNARGYGESEPLVDEESEEAFAENRRVEFRIVERGTEESAETADERPADAGEQSDQAGESEPSEQPASDTAPDEE